MEEKIMSKKSYESPKVAVLGEVTDMTQKYGIYFDYGYATEGKGTAPAPGSPGTVPGS